MQNWYGVEIFAEKCSHFLERHVFGNERRWWRFELSECKLIWFRNKRLTGHMMIYLFKLLT